MKAKRYIEHLNPTLWRTCRSLANRQRLRIFRFLLKHPGSTVSSVAAELSLSLPMASIYLRALNARGVLSVQRIGRFVEYSVSPDPSIPEAPLLVEALIRSFCDHQMMIQTVFRHLTGFTHPRRVQIISVLARSDGITFAGLRQLTSIPEDALRRHLSKLTRRGLVQHTKNGYYCTHPATTLPKTLISIASKKG